MGMEEVRKWRKGRRKNGINKSRGEKEEEEEIKLL